MAVAVEAEEVGSVVMEAGLEGLHEEGGRGQQYSSTSTT